MPHVLQRPLNARVPPLRIVGHHPHHQPPDVLPHARSPRAPPRIGPLPGDQFTVPAENRVGRHESCELAQQATSKPLAQQRETAALIIIQPQPSATQLCLEYAILFAEEGDHIALLAIQPSKQRGKQHLQRNHASTLRHGRMAQFSDSFMKRLCQVTRLVEAARVFIDRPPVSAQPSHPAKRDGRANGSHVVSLVVKRRSSPRRGEVAHPFMRALDGTVRAGRTRRIRRRSRAIYGTALRSGHLSERADSSSLTTSHSLVVHG